MKKKVLASLLTVAMAATMLVGCGSKAEAPADAPAADDAAADDAAEEAPADDAAADDTAEAPAAADGALIKVGIINNDPNESGYRTANDKDMKEFFTEANGYEASFISLS